MVLVRTDGGVAGAQTPAFVERRLRWAVPAFWKEVSPELRLRPSLSATLTAAPVAKDIGQPALHRRRDAKRLVDPAEVVVERVEADHAHPH